MDFPPSVHHLAPTSSLSLCPLLFLPSSCSHGYPMTLSIFKIVQGLHLISPSSVSSCCFSFHICSCFSSPPSVLSSAPAEDDSQEKGHQAGCYGNSKQVAAGCGAGEESEGKGEWKDHFGLSERLSESVMLRDYPGRQLPHLLTPRCSPAFLDAAHTELINPATCHRNMT